MTKSICWLSAGGQPISAPPTNQSEQFASPKRERRSEENVMNWVAPIVEEICVGMEVTSYESADLDVLF